jgi:ribonuclease VapC
MILDASALVAIFFAEPEAERYTRMIHEADQCLVSVASLVELAFLDFGKGRHPAGLNFGDCFSYALAKARREPLLFKGEDFAKTDVLQADPR